MKEETLDKIFSLYIRTRDSDREGNGFCCTCKKIIPIEGNHCGHYISRRHKATKWNEKNAHLQCARCNTFLKGNYDQYALFMTQMYGIGILEELNQEKRKITKLTPFDRKVMGNKFREKTKALIEIKNGL